MKSRLLYLILFFCPLTCGFAQTDFRPGFIVTLNQDTVSGQIDYRSNTRNYETCRFSKDGEVREFGPGELIGYGYNNDKYYASRIVEGSFVEVLVEGELSLYRFGGLFYMNKPGAGLYKIEAPDERINVDGKERVRKSTKWMGFVAFLTSDCSPGFDVIKKMPVGERALTVLVTRYNQCKGSTYVVYKASKPWTHIDAGVSAGLVRSSITMRSMPSLAYLSDQYKTISPSVGFVLGISSPRLSEKFAFQPEIHLIKSSYSSLVVDNYSSRTEYYDTFIDLTTISIPLALRYSFLERKYSVRLLAGINYDFQMQSNTRVINESVVNNTVTTTEDPFFSVRRNQLGYCGGLMVSRAVGKFGASLVLRYFSMSNMSSTLAVSAKTQKVALSIQLNRK